MEKSARLWMATKINLLKGFLFPVPKRIQVKCIQVSLVLLAAEIRAMGFGPPCTDAIYTCTCRCLGATCGSKETASVDAGSKVCFPLFRRICRKPTPHPYTPHTHPKTFQHWRISDCSAVQSTKRVVLDSSGRERDSAKAVWEEY